MAIKTRKIQLGIVVGWNPDWPDPRGVRVTAKNLQGLAEWIGGKTVWLEKISRSGDASDQKIKIFTDRGNRVRVARVGDVVVKFNKDHYDVIKKENFLGFEK